MRPQREWLVVIAAVVLLLTNRVFPPDHTESRPAGFGTPAPGSRATPSPEVKLRSSGPPLAESGADSPASELSSPRILPGPEFETGSLRAHWPERDQVRAEIEKNPHQAPPSLLDFAGVLGRLLARARRDGEFALELLLELEDCVRADSVIESARAVCLREADRLPGLHPEDSRLSLAAERVRDAAPERVRELEESTR